MSTADELLYVRREEEPILPPPRSETGAVGWMRNNLFSSTTNIILTLLGIALLVWIIPPIVRWALIDAVWTGSGRDACAASPQGACWPFVRARFGQFMYGFYPQDQRWRVNLTLILLVIGLVPMAIPRAPFKRENAIYMLGIFPIVALILLTGGHFDLSYRFFGFIILLGCLGTGLLAMATADHSPILGGLLAPGAVLLVIVLAVAGLLLNLDPVTVRTIQSVTGVIEIACTVLAVVAGVAAILTEPTRRFISSLVTLWIVVGIALLVFALLSANLGLVPVETSLWGGLTVTLVVAIVGIVASLPLGILLALGRRSRLPVIQVCSTIFIEFVRGVPLITVLFMSSVMLPLFLPPGVNFDKLLRALVGVSLFSAAYMAEVVRGGLQAVSRGQYEGAQALGLPYGSMMRLIILPQALKIVIPGIVNSFISLFKDTSLVLIIGIFDLLGIVQLGFSDANWAAPNTPVTGYVFAGLIFWAFCFSMSRYSIYMERRLNTGHKR